MKEAVQMNSALLETLRYLVDVGNYLWKHIRYKDGKSSDHPGLIEISIKFCAKESKRRIPLISR